MTSTLQAARKYAGPFTAIWAGFCLDLAAVSEEWITFRDGVVYAGFLLLSALYVFTMRDVKVLRRINEAQSSELATVHLLVNSQHDKEEDRNKQLIKALKTAGVNVPDEPKSRSA